MYPSQIATRRRTIVFSRLHAKRKVYAANIICGFRPPSSFYIKSRANREVRGEIAIGHARGRPSLSVSALIEATRISRSRAREGHVVQDYVGLGSL